MLQKVSRKNLRTIFDKCRPQNRSVNGDEHRSVNGDKPDSGGWRGNLETIQKSSSLGIFRLFGKATFTFTGTSYPLIPVHQIGACGQDISVENVLLPDCGGGMGGDSQCFSELEKMRGSSVSTSAVCQPIRPHSSSSAKYTLVWAAAADMQPSLATEKWDSPRCSQREECPRRPETRLLAMTKDDAPRALLSKAKYNAFWWQPLDWSRNWLHSERLWKKVATPVNSAGS